MKTVASTVEKDRIHLNLHHAYVRRPESRAKNEYQSLVSPIVLSGGRPKLIQRSTMNEASTRIEATLREIAHPLRWRYLMDDTDQWSFAHNANMAPPAEKAAERIPNHMKRSHVITSVDYIVVSSRSTYKKHEGTYEHYDDSRQGSISPWLSDNLKDAVFTCRRII